MHSSELEALRHELAEYRAHLEDLVQERFAQLEAEHARRMSLEVKLLARSRVEAVGDVSAGVAHEILQPLTYISGTLQLLRRDLAADHLDPERVRELTDKGLEQVQRISEIIAHMRALGCREALAMAPVDLREVLQRTQTWTHHRLALAGVEFEQHIEAELPPIRGSASMLTQVLLSLVHNSMDALEGVPGARIVVSVTAAKADREGVEVLFQDNGPGIAPDVRERIFEPFFSTRAVGQAPGLGLSICEGILREHRGTLRCLANPDEGAAFVLWLPSS